MWRSRVNRLITLFGEMPPQTRRVVWLVVSMWSFVFIASVVAADSPSAPWNAGWLTAQNLITLVCLIFALGTGYQQFKAMGERITKLEKDHEDLTNRHLPTEYLRKAGFDEYRRGVGRRRSSD